MARFDLGVDRPVRHDLDGRPAHPFEVGLDALGPRPVHEVRRDHAQLVGAAGDRGDQGRDRGRHEEGGGALGEEPEPAEPADELEGDRRGRGAAERGHPRLVGQRLLQRLRVGEVLAVGGGAGDDPAGERAARALERVGHRRGRRGSRPGRRRRAPPGRRHRPRRRQPGSEVASAVAVSMASPMAARSTARSLVGRGFGIGWGHGRGPSSQGLVARWVTLVYPVVAGCTRRRRRPPARPAGATTGRAGRARGRSSRGRRWPRPSAATSPGTSRRPGR